MVLTCDIIQSLRPHSRCQRRFADQLFVHLIIEKVHGLDFTIDLLFYVCEFYRLKLVGLIPFFKVNNIMEWFTVDITRQVLTKEIYHIIQKMI